MRAADQLVKADGQLVQPFNDPAPDILLETLDSGPSQALPLGYGSMVHAYGDFANEQVITYGYWPGVTDGVLTINDTSTGYKFTVTSGVLTIDDSASLANASLVSPGNVLIVSS